MQNGTSKPANPQSDFPGLASGSSFEEFYLHSLWRTRNLAVPGKSGLPLPTATPSWKSRRQPSSGQVRRRFSAVSLRKGDNQPESARPQRGTAMIRQPRQLELLNPKDSRDFYGIRKGFRFP